MPNIHDVARLAGVHRSTVSRVLTGKGSVSEKSRKKVLAVTREMNFHLNTVASALKSQKKTSLGLLSFWNCSPNPSESYYQQILTGIIDEISRSKFHLLLNNIQGTLSLENEQIKFCYESMLGGILLMAPRIKSETEISFINHFSIPALLLLYRTNDNRYSWVDLDNRKGAQLAVQHLIDLGHKRIAFIGGEMDYSSNARDRYWGYQESLKKAGIKEDPLLVRNGFFSGEYAQENMKQFLSLPSAQRPTAVFAATDSMAFGVMKVAQEAGLQIPRDLSIVGFDDYEKASLSSPTLTTVRQPFYQIGQKAVQLLESIVQNRSSRPHHLLIPPELIIRNSTDHPAKK